MTNSHFLVTFWVKNCNVAKKDLRHFTIIISCICNCNFLIFYHPSFDTKDLSSARQVGSLPK